MLERLAMIAFTAMALSACVSVTPQAEVVAGTVPPAIQGATWSSTPITYCTVRDEEGGFAEYQTFVALTQRAVEAWGMPAEYQGDCNGTITSGDGVNEIGWGDLGGAPANLNEAGTTNIRYRTALSGSPPEIVEADITIERVPARGRDSEECLYTTLLHETGHLFGVQHLDQSAVMAPVIEECRQELTPSDHAAISELYGGT